MKNNRDIKLKSLFGYLAAAVSVIVMASIPGLAQADLTAGFSSCVSFSFSGGGFGGGGGNCGALGTGGIGESLCTIVDWFRFGGIGAAVASMAVIFMGIAAFFGKVTWGMALVTASSIFAIFGSEEIVTAILKGTGAYGMYACP